MRECDQRMFFPLFLSLEGKICLIVGAGAVALRKIQVMIPSRARITVVSPEVIPEIESISTQGAISLKKRKFRSEDLDGATVVIVATNDSGLNKEISVEAAERRILCNVVDKPELCSAIFPAIVSRGSLQIAISTGGASPSLASSIKSEISELFGDEYALALDILCRLRREILRRDNDTDNHKKIFQGLVDSQLVQLCKEGNCEEIDLLIKKIAGADICIGEPIHKSENKSSPGPYECSGEM
jgi:precorrin-2 dehydrogenase / sirohydrochlorin ferrochelatase